MSLKARLIAQIEATGPLTVAQYMAACLHDPREGYYATRPALGEDGDFVTAPLVSQMFGELIGLWLIAVWRQMGEPDPVRLVEVGPGDGTLMSDILRAAKADPAFLAAADVWLVETSGPLRERQQARLGDLTWTQALVSVPGGAPILIVANELLDCLPARQFVRVGMDWAERVIVAHGDGLIFGVTGAPPDMGPKGHPEGTVLEISPAQEAFAAEVAQRIALDGGAALLIDYGRIEPDFGDTLQALHDHQKRSPLEAPGEDDLTIHADFSAAAAAAAKVGVGTVMTTQGAFLRALGLDARCEALACASPDQRGKLERQRDRLAADDQMGELFKVLAIHSPGLDPPGFDG